MRFITAFATFGFIFALNAGVASASKQPVDAFGSAGILGSQFGNPVGVAVNQSGVGPAQPGDVYVVDASNNRIQRFGHDDNGTPSETSDDTYFFISAWGADVDSTPSGGSDYETCTVAADCKAGVASGGNGNVAGNGTLAKPQAIALDEDSGNVYVADLFNYRVDVYDGAGSFLRAFGWDVVESGPGNTGTSYEVCIAASGDICKVGLPGSGTGQFDDFFGRGAEGIAVSQPDGNLATGTVFLADTPNSRVNTYALDGSSPDSFGSTAQFPLDEDGRVMGPTKLAVDSRGIVYAATGIGGANAEKPTIERYDSQNANGSGVGFLAPIATGVNEVQQVTISATSGAFNLSFGGHTTVDLSYNLPAQDGQSTPDVIDSVEEALQALPSIGKQGVAVSGGPGNATGSSPYKVGFRGGLGARDVEQIAISSGAKPLSGGSGASAATLTAGEPGLVPSNMSVEGLAVDPDSDGAGPDVDVLYAQQTNGATVVMHQFGPGNPPGLIAPPTVSDEVHGTTFGAYSSPRGLAIDQPTGRLYLGAFSGEAGRAVYVLDEAGPPPPAPSTRSAT